MTPHTHTPFALRYLAFSNDTFGVLLLQVSHVRNDVAHNTGLASRPLTQGTVVRRTPLLLLLEPVGAAAGRRAPSALPQLPALLGGGPKENDGGASS